MRKSAKALVGILGGSALMIGLGAPAHAATATGETDGWVIGVHIPDVTWSTVDSCEQIPLDIDVDGWGAQRWSVNLEVRNADTGTVIPGSHIMAYGTGEANGSWASDFQMCPGSPTTPGTYIVSGVAEYGYDFDYTGRFSPQKPGQLSAPLSTTFTVTQMASTTVLDPIKSEGWKAELTGRLTVQTPTTGIVGYPNLAEVVVQELKDGVWQDVDYAITSPGGQFKSTVYGASTSRPIRATFHGNSKVRGSISSAVVPQPPAAQAPAPAPAPAPVVAPAAAPAPAPGPAAIAKVKATGGKSRLFVDVNPDAGMGYWTFQVQRQQADGSWKPLKTYKSKGSKETRSINLPRGTYQVVVNPKYGWSGSTSAPVYLKK